MNEGPGDLHLPKQLVIANIDRLEYEIKASLLASTFLNRVQGSGGLGLRGRSSGFRA